MLNPRYVKPFASWDGHGYTCNLDEAEIFDGEDERFQIIANDNSKYTAWEQEYIDSCAHRHVDSQYINYDAKSIRKYKSHLIHLKKGIFGN